MTLRTVIVDDEPLARELLTVLLAEHEEIQIMAECQNGREAISYLESKPVDLLFLDVQMPKVGGFDVVEQVGLQHMPPTIFVTAFQEHAVRSLRRSCCGLPDEAGQSSPAQDRTGSRPGEDRGEDRSHDTGAAYGCAEWVAQLDRTSQTLSLPVPGKRWR
jgi:CheY-like chemotaxis protein